MLSINCNLLFPYLKKSDYKAIAGQVRQVHTSLLERSCRGNDMLGWIDLPVNQTDAELDTLQKAARDLAAKAPYVVVVGIGGSYLGSRCAIEFLQPQWQTHPQHPNVLFFGHHLGSAYAAELLRFLEDKDYSVCAISKSGSTTETGVAFRILRQQMEKKFTEQEMRERILVVTEPTKGSLLKVVQSEKYEHLPHPEDVGGRFSVLSTVGLLPMAVRGIDIHSLLQGAAAMRRHCLEEKEISANKALCYAASRYLLYRKGKVIENLSLFESTLQFFGEWWKQLYGESEGKKHRGLFPATSMMTTDLHSMGQYLQDGKRNLFETFLLLEKNPCSLTVEAADSDEDELNYLAGIKLSDINRRAYEATALAHHQGGVPSITIKMKERSPFILGQLFYLFEFSVAVSALLLGVNPFDQPGVEAYKKNMFALLGRPGYQNLKARVEKDLKKLSG